MYEPTLPKLAVVKSRISPEAWEARVEAAQRDEMAMSAIKASVDGGLSLNEAIRRSVPGSRRSWVRRNWHRYLVEGLEALIDQRTPREPTVSKQCADLIQGARAADPTVTAERVLEILRARKLKNLPSLSTIRLHFARVDARARYAKGKQAAETTVEELPFAGGELLRAAEVETGAISALTDEVMALAEEAKEASTGSVPERDVEYRDARGRFTDRYNRRRRRKRGEEIASYHRSAKEKAEGRVPSWPRFVHERRETLEAKLATLVLSPLAATTKGWDALRAPDVAGLEPLTGFAYMPSTLAKMTSALAISDAGPRLLEALGRNWHHMAQERWGERGAVAALYVDNHAKEVWSSLFTMSGKVSNLNRVMPCITTTYVHTGAGTPLVAAVQSGSAPLAPRLVQLIEEAEAKLEGTVRRAVVIDAEGSTFDILETFAKEKRVIVTPLRPSRSPGLDLTYSPGSYFRPYRENDELRCASAVLTHKSSGRALEIGALIVRRSHRETDTVLLTTGLSLGMTGRDLADLYFARWPIQENMFRDGAAVDLAEHRGNCGQMVANVAVVTEVERLGAQVQTAKEKLESLNVARRELERTLSVAEREHARTKRALATRRRRLDYLIAAGRREGRQLGDAAVEHQKALVVAERSEATRDDIQTKLTANLAAAAKQQASLEKAEARREKLAPRQTIRQLDVAQDMVLTSTKLTCSLLITFAIREYLSMMPMTPHTFASRLFGIRGRREQTADEEIIVFYENPRDPEVNAALHDACIKLNRRRLTRDGRTLRYTIAPHDES